MYTIVRYLINRSLITYLVLVFILVLAAASLFNIKRLGYPRVDLDEVNITTIYPGASPEDVELNVTFKLEEALEGVDGIEKFESRSMENRSFINIDIDSEAEDKDQVKADIRRAVDGVSDLPPEVEEKPQIFEVKVDNFDIYEIAFTLSPQYYKTHYSDKRGNRLSHEDEDMLRTYILELKDRILDLPTVSKVYENGIRDREVKILINKQKMAAQTVGFDEVVQAIRNNKLRLSGGNIESYTSETGLVTFAEFENPTEVGDVIVRANFAGQKVRVRDVARIEDGFAKEDTIMRFNGRPGMSIEVVKKGPADIIDTVESVRAIVRDFKKEIHDDRLIIFPAFDDSLNTKNRLDIVVGNAIAGFILVLFVLFFFLDSRIAFWTAAGIPVSVAVTFIVMPMLDITINSISLCGMVVVLGMVVDDAIIIGESVYRYIEEGFSPSEAALKGLRVVIKPVLGTIITTMLAFVPIYFLPGSVGRFGAEIPSIVILMLAASFIEATLFLPAHLAHSGRTGKSGRTTEERKLGQRLISQVEGYYRKMLVWCLDNKYKTFGLFTAFLVVGGLLGFLVTTFNQFPIDQSVRMMISGEAALGSNLERTARVAGAVEEVVFEREQEHVDKFGKPILQAVKTNVGRDRNSNVKPSNYFNIRVDLIPATERQFTAADIRDYVKSNKDRLFKSGLKKIDFTISGGGPPAGKPIEIKISGPDNKKREALVKEIIAHLNENYPVSEVDSDLRIGKPEIRLLPRFGAIAESALDVRRVAATIRTAYDGSIATYQQTSEEKIALRVVLDERSKNYQNPLDGLLVQNGQGNLVGVESLVRQTRTQSTQTIYHYNRKRTNTITANVDLKATTPAALYYALEEHYGNFSRTHPGFKLELGGEAKESSETITNMLVSIGLAVVAIFFLLVIQFNSFSQPVLVILAVPFGLVGIFLAFGLQGMDLSMLALIGILGFAGVVINDSLIMVDFINRLKRTGNVEESPAVQSQVRLPTGEKTDWKEAVIEGACLRMRPILLTTVTTVVGLVPTAYGLVGGLDSFISPLVMAMTWGLLVGTTSVMFIMPVLYAIHEDISSGIAELTSRQPG